MDDHDFDELLRLVCARDLDATAFPAARFHPAESLEDLAEDAPALIDLRFEGAANGSRRPPLAASRSAVFARKPP